MFEKNAYFDHSKNRAILKKEELEAIVSLLKSDINVPKRNLTNWEYLIELWNFNNDRYEIPYDLEMPSYSFDTIQTYQETKDKKKVYDESGTLSHYIPDECPWSFE